MQLQHFMYPRSTMQQADAVAWVLADKDSPLIMYPFKFPDIAENQVRLKILFTSICQSDILTVRESWGPCNYPACPGHEIIGEITLVGSDVKDRKIGDKVGVSPIRYSDGDCRNCKSSKQNLCDNRVFLYSDGYFGGYATHIQVSSNWTFPLPKNIDLSIAAPLLCAGVTVYAPLKRYGKAGKSCAVIGIGGLGHLAIQYANKLGMIVTAFTTKVHQPQKYKQMGASYVEHSTDLAQLNKNKQQYDVVINTLFIPDEDVYKAHQRLTAPNGVYIQVGIPNFNSKFKIDTSVILRNQLTIAGSVVGSIAETQDTIEFAANYNIKPICQFFDFADFGKALERAQKSTPQFRCVVRVNQWAKKNGFDK